MRRIFVKDLRAGQVLPKALFTESGLKLLPSGSRLTRGRVSSLRRAYSGPLYLATSYGELRAGLSGETYAGPSAAIELGVHGRRKLSREEQTAADTRREWMREIRRTERDMEEQIDEWSSLERRVEAAVKPEELAAAGRLGWPSPARLRAYRADRVRRIALAHRAIASRERVSVQEPMYLVRELMDLYMGYPDRYARLATFASGDEHPAAEHALRVAALASAMGLQMGWSASDAQRVGLAGVFADLGMVLEPMESKRSLDDLTAARMRRHPLAGAVMLGAVDGAPESVRLAVAQHHERLDGTGYPLGERGERVHDYAKVLAVADCFAAAITDRPHRGAKRPHAALVDVCRRALTGSLDRRATMALVRVTGVFPVGASVALDSGEAAVVVSNRADMPGRPTLRLFGDEVGAVELDLSVVRGVRIASELAPGEHGSATAG